MASKYYKAYKFLTGGKSRPGIVGVKPKSGGVVDEFKSKKLKSLGKTQRKLKAQDKGMDEAIEAAKKKGLSRKDTVKGRKFQRDNRRAQREGDKLRKDVLRVGKAKGGKVDDKKKTKKPLGGKLKKPRPGSYDYQLQETMKPPYKRKEMEKGGMPETDKERQRRILESVKEKRKKDNPKRKMTPEKLEKGAKEFFQKKNSDDAQLLKKGGSALKPVDKKKNPGLAKLPTQVRNKMGYMKKGGRVRKFGGGKK